jgi:nitrogen fixation NifU-like protein
MDYREEILDHYRYPRNQGVLHYAHGVDENPLCGDSLAMDIVFEEDITGQSHVTLIRFQGTGCAISQASASMLSEYMQDKTLEEIKTLNTKHVLSLLGINISPARTKCAYLCLHVLHNALITAGLEKVPLPDSPTLLE